MMTQGDAERAALDAYDEIVRLADEKHHPMAVAYLRVARMEGWAARMGALLYLFNDVRQHATRRTQEILRPTMNMAARRASPPAPLDDLHIRETVGYRESARAFADHEVEMSALLEKVSTLGIEAFKPHVEPRVEIADVIEYMKRDNAAFMEHVMRTAKCVQLIVVASGAKPLDDQQQAGGKKP